MESPDVLSIIQQNTTDDANGNAANQDFTPFTCTCYVPGQRIIHIVLPRNTTARNPMNAAEALGISQWAPITGNTATVLFPINTPLAINAVGVPLVGYSLSDFMFTYTADVAPGSLLDFMFRLSCIVDINPSLDRCADLVAAQTVMFPILVSQTNIAGVQFAVNSAEQVYFCNSACINPQQTVVNWPQALPTRADMLVRSTDPVAWNKVCLQLATSPSVITAGNYADLEPFMGNAKAIFWHEERALLQAVCFTSHYANFGMPASIWNTAFANIVMKAPRKIVLGHYTKGTSGSITVQPSFFGPSLRNYFCNLFECSPAIYSPTNPTTFFDFYCPPVTGAHAYSGGITAAGNQVDLTPNCVPDVWIHFLSAHTPKWQSSYPVPSGADSCAGYDGGSLSMNRIAAALVGPIMDASEMSTTIDQNKTSNPSDSARWNKRIMIATQTVTWVTQTGVAFANAPAANSWPLQRVVSPDVTMPNLQFGFNTASTICIPDLDANGDRVVPTVTAAASVPLYNIYTRQQKASIIAWLINNVMSNSNVTNSSDSTLKSVWFDIAESNSVKIVSNGEALTNAQTSTNPVAKI
jgi:hypothetical protein